MSLLRPKRGASPANHSAESKSSIRPLLNDVARIEALERRFLLSGSNAIDRIDFGNATSEAAHNFDAGLTNLPPEATGALGLAYREISGPPSGQTGPQYNEVLTFTMTVDPFLQN